MKEKKMQVVGSSKMVPLLINLTKELNVLLYIFSLNLLLFIKKEYSWNAKLKDITKSPIKEVILDGGVKIPIAALS